MLDMRLKLPTLMATAGMRNAYALMKASKGELTITTATRLVRADGRPKRIDMTTLDTLCRMFGVGPGGLLECDEPLAAEVAAKPKRKAAAKKGKAKPKRPKR